MTTQYFVDAIDGDDAAAGTSELADVRERALALVTAAIPVE